MTGTTIQGPPLQLFKDSLHPNIGTRCLSTVNSKKLERRCKMIYAGVPSFLGLGWRTVMLKVFWRLLRYNYQYHVEVYLKRMRLPSKPRGAKKRFLGK